MSDPSTRHGAAEPGIPAALLQAVAAPGGAKLALVVGAGCSVEPPTGVPVASKCSLEIHRRLVADGVLKDGQCADPTDLSAVADAVFAVCGSQKPVVERLGQQYDLKLAPPNDGYFTAAALLIEGALDAVVTLNFDLALTAALASLGGGEQVGVVDGPEHLGNQKKSNVYYLHRNANAEDPEKWVLRTAVLDKAWQGGWEQVVATRALVAPVVTFVGLGTPVGVLIESTKLLRNAVPLASFFQVDPGERAESKFSAALGLPESAYVRLGWCQFMAEMGRRLMQEHAALIGQAITNKVHDDALTGEDVAGLVHQLVDLGLLRVGRIKAEWLLHSKPYRPMRGDDPALVADLLLALAMVGRVTGAKVAITDDGIVEFYRDGRVVAASMLASGCGHRGRSAVEADLSRRRRQLRRRVVHPTMALVGGTSDAWGAQVSPPPDVVRGATEGDIITGPETFRLVHISQLRAQPETCTAVVPL